MKSRCEFVDRNEPNYEHRLRGNLRIDTSRDFVKCNSYIIETVILCHLGQETTEPKECVAEIQKIVPVANVFVAERGVEIELRNKNECPF